MSVSAPVLVVEDERTIRQGLQELLELEGYRVVAAEGGAQALAVLAGERPSVVVLDLLMPDVSGADVVDEMQRDPRLQGVPVIMVSAVGQALAPMAGVVEILQKPVDPTRLVDTVRRYAGEP